ncbi:hypothetical protein TWF281_000547 [Arthrobotrys megalospora]
MKGLHLALSGEGGKESDANVGTFLGKSWDDDVSVKNDEGGRRKVKNGAIMMSPGSGGHHADVFSRPKTEKKKGVENGAMIMGSGVDDEEELAMSMWIMNLRQIKARVWTDPQ